MLLLCWWLQSSLLNYHEEVGHYKKKMKNENESKNWGRGRGTDGKMDTLALISPIRRFKQNFWAEIKEVQRPLLTQYICVFWFVSVLFVTSRFAVLKEASVCLTKSGLNFTSWLGILENVCLTYTIKTCIVVLDCVCQITELIFLTPQMQSTSS